MRFLSLSQPWLWAVLDPKMSKHIENRSWMPPISMIGEQIALHAAKSWDDDAIAFFLRLGFDHFPARRALYETSAIVGVAHIGRVVTESKSLSMHQAQWFFGPCGWVLENVHRLDTPIPMKGAQGLRGLPDEVATEVRRQLYENGPCGHRDPSTYNESIGADGRCTTCLRRVP